MGKGYLRLTMSGEAMGQNPVVIVKDLHGRVISKTCGDSNGNTPRLPIDTPDAVYGLRTEDADTCFTLTDVEVGGAEGFAYVSVRNIPIFDGVTTVLPVTLSTVSVEGRPQETALSPLFGVQLPHAQPVFGGVGAFCEALPRNPRRTPFSREMRRFACTIHPALYTPPESIVVHLGRPAAEAPDVRISLADYLKTAASCELFPHWPTAALEANIYCILSVTLRRLRAHDYRRSGYPFDITSAASFDPYYVHGRPLFENIADIVDRLMPTRIMRRRYPGIAYTPYCNGATGICPGLSQWGSAALASEGLSAIEILRHYFGTDLIIVTR